MKRKLDHICIMCYPGAEDIAKICDGFYLCKVEDKYCIVGGQGHSGDIVHTYESAPFVIGNSDRFNRQMQVLDMLNRNIITMNVMWGFNLVKGCKEQRKYNPEVDGFNFDSWMFVLCAKLIREHGKKRK